MIRSLGVCVALLLLTACGKFSAGKSPLDRAFFSPGEESLNPSTDKLSANCLNAPEFDACIFAKNPVAQEKGAVQVAEADAKRLFGVKVRGLSTSGFLENGRVQVYSLQTPRFNISARGDLKTSGRLSAAGQFSAYYWSNRMFDYLGARVGSERLPLRDLKIYADDAFTGYSAVNHSVHFEQKDGVLPKVFNGEVVIHLTAQALADALSEGRLFQRDSTQHNFCSLDPKGCCKTEMGCAQALGSGFGEYTAAMMFPDSPRVGESISGLNEGQRICSLARDLASLSARTKTQVFQACAIPGRAALMGAWYASVWWKLRKQLEAQESGADADVDKLFFDHARVFSSTSTFATAKAEALRLAATYKGGKYSAAFLSAFAGI